MRRVHTTGVDSKVTIKTKEESRDHLDNPDASFLPGTYRVATNEWTPLSCKSHQFFIVLGKIYEECSYPGT